MESELKENELKKNKKVYLFDAFLVFVILAAIVVYLLKVEGIDNIVNTLKIADYRWIAAGLGCLIAMWICEALTLQVSLKKMYPDQKLGNSFKITLIGQLFNNITPFASGGQLMQAYVMHKEGKRTSDTASALVVKYVITQSLLILFTIVVVLSQFSFFARIFKDLIWIGVIGIVLNVGVVLAFFMAGENKNFVMKIARPCIRFFGKIHIGKIKFVKNPEEKIKGLEESVDNFSEQFHKMKKQKGRLLVMAITALLQSVFYYAITYMIYKAFGNYGTSFLQVITAQAFLMLIMTVFPTPGAGLGAEGGFMLLFSEIFLNGTITMSIVFWRLFIFYLPLVVGTLFFIPTMRKINKQSEAKKIKEVEGK